MQNGKIYCLCLHNRVLSVVKKLGYEPVGVGNDNFSNDWLLTLEICELIKDVSQDIYETCYQHLINIAKSYPENQKLRA